MQPPSPDGNVIVFDGLSLQIGLSAQYFPNGMLHLTHFDFYTIAFSGTATSKCGIISHVLQALPHHGRPEIACGSVQHQADRKR